MKVVAAPLPWDLQPGHSNDLEIVLYGHADRADRAGVGFQIPDKFRKLQLRPANRAWDFLSIALAVQGADASISRDESPDGWTRQIELTISVADPFFWTTQASLIEKALRFLTTDIWSISFQPGGFIPAPPKEVNFPKADAVSLLSGGLDSLVGAIDFRAAGKWTPYLASQVSSGDKIKQKYFAQVLRFNHLQLNHVVTTPSQSERSQRARSIVFLAYGALLGSSLYEYQKGNTIPLFVCENGFISINPPLTPMRQGSLSTRTTHPIYFRLVQDLFDAAHLAVSIVNPYQLHTKGEMLQQCRDQETLRQLAASSTSCGRYARNGFVHCGRCVPCIIRRSAFHKWGVPDSTKYRHHQLAKQDKNHAGFDDVRALLMASEMASANFSSWFAASLCSNELQNTSTIETTVSRGIAEVRDFLVASGVK